MNKQLKDEELVRYEHTREADDDEDEEENEEGEDEYIDYDFVNNMTTNLNNFNINDNKDDLISDYCSELNNNNKFVSMSRFDEASKSGFALQGNLNSALNKNLAGNDYYIHNYNQRNNIPSNQYETNLTNVNENFNFNYESEIDFEADFNKNKINKIVEDNNNLNNNLFFQESYLKSTVFHKVNDILPDDNKRIAEIKSQGNINNKIKDKVISHVSTDEIDGVILKTVSEDDLKK